MASPTDEHELEYAPGVGNGQGSLGCCSPWGCKESDMTEWLNWTEYEKRLWKRMNIHICKTESLLTVCLKLTQCLYPNKIKHNSQNNFPLFLYNVALQLMLLASEKQAGQRCCVSLLTLPIKTPQLGWLQQQTFISHSFRNWMSKIIYVMLYVVCAYTETHFSFSKTDKCFWYVHERSQQKGYPWRKWKPTSWFPSKACCILFLHVCMHAKLLQSCPTLWDPMDCSLPGSSVHGILQVRILEWVPMPSSRGSFWPRDQIHGSWVSRIGRQILYR